MGQMRPDAGLSGGEPRHHDGRRNPTLDRLSPRMRRRERERHCQAWSARPDRTLGSQLADMAHPIRRLVDYLLYSPFPRSPMSPRTGHGWTGLIDSTRFSYQPCTALYCPVLCPPPLDRVRSDELAHCKCTKNM